jgi:hypothetical protein
MDDNPIVGMTNPQQTDSLSRARLLKDTLNFLRPLVIQEAEAKKDLQTEEESAQIILTTVGFQIIGATRLAQALGILPHDFDKRSLLHSPVTEQ